MEKWALISVFNKDGIVDFARQIIRYNWRLLASGGTKKVLEAAGMRVRDVAELTGMGAILDHRVVTLSAQIHAGLLADKRNESHMAELTRLNWPVIDMVVCDFYPLADAVRKPIATTASVIESTDIGGPAMVRSAAKGGRIVLCRRKDWDDVLGDLRDHGEVFQVRREHLRARAEFEVANYCLLSAAFHSAGQFHGVLSDMPLKA